MTTRFIMLTLIYVICMEFLSLRSRRSSSRDVPGPRGEERVEQLFSQAIWEQGAFMQHIDHVSS